MSMNSTLNERFGTGIKFEKVGQVIVESIGALVLVLRADEQGLLAKMSGDRHEIPWLRDRIQALERVRDNVKTDETYWLSYGELVLFGF